MNLDEIKLNILQKLSIYKSQVLFDPNSNYMRELELILKLIAALELAIKQRDGYRDNYHAISGLNPFTRSEIAIDNDKEIEELLK